MTGGSESEDVSPAEDLAPLPQLAEHRVSPPPNLEEAVLTRIRRSESIAYTAGFAWEGLKAVMHEMGDWFARLAGNFEDEREDRP